MMTHRFLGLTLFVVIALVACSRGDPTLTAETVIPVVTNTMASPMMNNTNTPQPDPTGIQVTPIILPNVPSATPACVGTLPTRLIVGERGQVDDRDDIPLNVRSGPSTTEFRVLGRLETGEVFQIMDGPECGGAYVWYLIRNQNGLEGWIAEGEEWYFVQPYLPG